VFALVELESYNAEQTLQGRVAQVCPIGHLSDHRPLTRRFDSAIPAVSSRWPTNAARAL
jgi:hypothetical protein